MQSTSIVNLPTINKFGIILIYVKCIIFKKNVPLQQQSDTLKRPQDHIDHENRMCQLTNLHFPYMYKYGVVQSMGLALARLSVRRYCFKVRKAPLQPMLQHQQPLQCMLTPFYIVYLYFVFLYHYLFLSLIINVNFYTVKLTNSLFRPSILRLLDGWAKSI